MPVASKRLKLVATYAVSSLGRVSGPVLARCHTIDHPPCSPSQLSVGTVVTLYALDRHAARCITTGAGQSASRAGSVVDVSVTE